MSSSAAGGSHVRQLKGHSWTWQQEVCKHFFCSCPLWRSPALFLLHLIFFLQSKTISCRSVKLTPPRLLQRSLSLCFLVLSGDSLTILCSRSNPDLQGSLPGAPFNCLVQPAASRHWNDSAQIWSQPIFPCYFLLGWPFPLNACPLLITYYSLTLLYLPQAGYWYSVTYTFPSVYPLSFQKNK